ncbi:ABC transporter permease subunit [Niveispirillum sp. SYP-B3756]|uniref:amino acid ABC transporter permease n=1 Tax=Niveispirillum sp. SYP-B3756 TaxID=2662178 RepID=UPI001292655F|nr:ABC transporter permease subunit [Niveispirillum sp. SYP-B3756]MQP68539.1 ABC transporter permease subunit [Niveispirillum sp. SYP-B3756]
MVGYDWNFDVLTPFWGAFLRGTAVTIALSVGSFILGTIVGTACGAALRSVPGARVLFIINDCVRAVPPLVLLFLVHYFPTSALFGLPPPSPFLSALLAFAIAQAAYTADITRSAINQVPRSLLDGGLAIGLRHRDLWRYIVIPHAVRQMLPAQIAFFIGIVRLSNLASVIGCQEVVFVGRVISAQAFRSLEPWILIAGIYIALIVPLTVLLREFEAKLMKAPL